MELDNPIDFSFKESGFCTHCIGGWVDPSTIFDGAEGKISLTLTEIKT
jgi:hypothetical protein